MLALYIIAGIVLFALLVLAIPVDILLELEVYEHVTLRMRLGWLFGLVGKDIHRSEEKKPRRKIKRKPGKKIWDKKNGELVFSILRTRGLLARAFKLVRQVLNCPRMRQVDARIRVGLGDPFDTGMMCAVFWPFLTSPDWHDVMSLSVEPVFDRVTFEANLRGKVRLFPIQVLWYLVSFIFSLAGLRIFKLMVVTFWKQKKCGLKGILPLGK